ncbi:hypothetical protein WICPIJ_001439 [Wickerhamomyces pijperi]|uniref:Fibronectin type-III domain-containing protein n=1 Tax=Wickerhamomyces pijperi TaxID=599730 RepID=A0A9P8QAX5_WICPI|nr:hypothetical protein WICPIJ_001439 [Wickerhamomyces pijperi]
MYYWAISMVAVAIISLLRRLWALRLIPTEELVKVLNIDIPKSSKISIDNITKNKVFIHWEIPTIKEGLTTVSKIAYFILFINDKQLLVLSPNEKSVCLSDLLPNTCYKLDLITVNASGYRSKSESVHIRTESTKIDEIKNKAVLENPESLFKLLTCNQVDVSSIHKISTPLTQNVNNIMASGNRDEMANDDLTNANTTANASSNFGATLNVNLSQRTGGRSRSNTANSDMNRSSVYPAASATYFNLDQDPREIYNIDDLRWYLESGQDVLRELIAQQEQTLAEFKESEALLVKERDTLRERVKLGINNKKALASEAKMLEDSRRLIELKKKKMISNLEKRKNNIEQKVTELDKWNKMLDEFDTEKQKLMESEKKIHAELDSDIKAIGAKVAKLQAALNEVEEEYKRSNHNRRHCEAVLPVLSEAVATLNRNMDNSGCVNHVGLQALEALKKVDEAIYQQLKEVVDHDSKLEAEWKTEQQKEVDNCLQVSKAFDLVKNENHQIKQVIHSQALQRQASSTTPPQNYTMTNQSQQQIPSVNAGNIAVNNAGAFTYPSLMNAHSNITQAPYSYDMLGSNPSLSSFFQVSQQQQQPQQQQPTSHLASSQFPSSSPWQNHRSTASYISNSSLGNTANNISLGLSSINDANGNGFGSTMNRFQDNINAQLPVSQGFLPTNLIGDEINSDSFFSPNFSNQMAQVNQSHSTSNMLIQPTTTNSSAAVGGTGLNLHYNHAPQMNDASGSRGLFPDSHSSGFSFDNNVNPGLLNNINGHEEQSVGNGNSPPHSHEFLSAHNSPNQGPRTNNELTSLLSSDGTNIADYPSQIKPSHTNSVMEFGNTIDSFVTANSHTASIGNENSLMDSHITNDGTNSRESHSGSFPRRFSSLFTLGFGKKNNNGEEQNELGDSSGVVVAASPQKHQHSKFFRPSSEVERANPLSGSSMETSTSSMPNNGSVFPFMNSSNVEQLDLWNVPHGEEFGSASWNVSSQAGVNSTPAITPSTSSTTHLGVNYASSTLSDVINKVPTNSQRSVGSSQVIDEEDETTSELGSEIGTPTQKVFTNKSFTNSDKSRGSHSAETQSNSGSSFFRSKFLGNKSDQFKSPNKTNTPAKIDDSDLEEYNHIATPGKTSIFSSSSSSHSAKKKSRKQSSSSSSYEDGNNNNVSSAGSVPSSSGSSGCNEQQQNSSLKSFRRLSLFNGRNSGNE